MYLLIENPAARGNQVPADTDKNLKVQDEGVLILVPLKSESVS